MAIVNKQNFLQWDDGTVSTDQPEIPWSYWIDRGRCSHPIAYPTEAMSFYINTSGDVGFAFADFADLRLAIVEAHSGTVINGNVGTLQQHILDGGTNYNIYCTFVLPALADKKYYLRIYRNTGGTILLTSSLIQGRANKPRLDITSAYFKFRHDRYFYGIPYAAIPAFYQQFRLPMAIIERQVEGDKEVYNEVTTGKPRTFENMMGRWIKLEMYYLTQEGHDAAAVMFNHNTLEINGRTHRPKTQYKENTNQRSATTKGEIELWEDEFASANRC